MNLPVNPSASAAPVVETSDVHCENVVENDVIIATNAELYDRPPRCMQSTFVKILRHWVVNKYDDTLEVGSVDRAASGISVYLRH